jgi:hypothetical protein
MLILASMPFLPTFQFTVLSALKLDPGSSVTGHCAGSIPLPSMLHPSLLD